MVQAPRTAVPERALCHHKGFWTPPVFKNFLRQLRKPKFSMESKKYYSRPHSYVLGDCSRDHKCEVDWLWIPLSDNDIICTARFVCALLHVGVFWPVPAINRHHQVSQSVLQLILQFKPPILNEVRKRLRRICDTSSEHPTP